MFKVSYLFATLKQKALSKDNGLFAVCTTAKALYGALFEAVWQTLSRFGASRKQLQGQLGATEVLHTWGQNLSQHIHLHCLIPGGALTVQGKWRFKE